MLEKRNEDGSWPRQTQTQVSLSQAVGYDSMTRTVAVDLGDGNIVVVPSLNFNRACQN